MSDDLDADKLSNGIMCGHLLLKLISVSGKALCYLLFYLLSI